MTRKRNSILRVTTITILTMMMLFSAISPVLAAPPPPAWKTGYLEGTPEWPADAYITKLLNMAGILDTPATTTDPVDFRFTVTPIGIDDAGMPTDGTVMPTIPAITISFDGTEPEHNNTSGSIKAIPLVSTGIFSGVTWPRAGVYQYKVKEIPNTYIAHRGDDYTEIMTYSGAEYDIEVWVERDSSYTGSPPYDIEFYAKYVATKLTAKRDSYWSTGSVGDKINADEEAAVLDTYIAGNYSQMVFTNIYTKFDGEPENPPPPDPPLIEGDTVLKIQKLVSGIGADRDWYFDFDVTVTYTSVIIIPPGHISKVYLVEGNVVRDFIIASGPGAGDGNILPGMSSNVDTDADGQQFYEFTPGTTFTISLKHGQYLAFTTAPIGTEYIVKEVNGIVDSSSNPIYVASAVQKNSDGAFSDASAVGDPLTVSGVIGSNTVEADSVVFTNSISGTTPTGITLDNLPYYALIGVAVLALAGYVIIKVRKRARYTAER